MNTEATEDKNTRKIFSMTVFGWLLAIFIYRFFSDSLLHQLQQSALITPEIDNTYWLFHYLQIPEFLTRSSAIPIMFDVVLFGLIITCIFISRFRIFPVLLLILLWTYFIVFNTFAGHHYYYVGFLFIVIPFLARENSNRDLLFNAVRYLFCFFYVSSALYKLFRGSVFNPEQMQSILMNDNASVIYHNPDSFHSDAILYFIQHPSLSQAVFVCAALIELSFFLGFFTKKYDLWFLLGLILFHTGNYFMTGIPFLEQSIIFLVFVPREKFRLLYEGIANRKYQEMKRE